MKSIYIYDEDLQRLNAMTTWKKFKGCSYADMIKWILENDVIGDEIHSKPRVTPEEFKELWNNLEEKKIKEEKMIKELTRK